MFFVDKLPIKSKKPIRCVPRGQNILCDSLPGSTSRLFRFVVFVELGLLGMELNSRRTLQKLFLLGALYFVQGLPFGFQVTALPVFLRVSGFSLENIGFATGLSLPWLLKPLWAPFVDRYGSERFGRRKSWIIPMQVGLAITCGISVFMVNFSLTCFLIGVFLMNFFAATQDIAVDGLAVDLLATEELGLGNSAQVVGYKAGMLTGGGLLVWASGSIGWSGLFVSMSVVIVGVMLITLLFQEPKWNIICNNNKTMQTGYGEVNRSIAGILNKLLIVMRSPTTIWLLIFIGSYKIGEAMIDTMFKPFLVDWGMSVPLIGLWMGAYGMLFSLTGSLVGGMLASLLTPLRAVGILAILRIVPLIGEWLLALGYGSYASIFIITSGEHFFGGALTTAMFALMMFTVNKQIGATHYTVLAAVEVLGKSPASLFSGVLAEKLGYAGLFGLGTLLSVAFLLLLIPLFRANSEMKANEL